MNTPAEPGYVDSGARAQCALHRPGARALNHTGGRDVRHQSTRKFQSIQIITIVVFGRLRDSEPAVAVLPRRRLVRLRLRHEPQLGRQREQPQREQPQRERRQRYQPLGVRFRQQPVGLRVGERWPFHVFESRPVDGGQSQPLDRSRPEPGRVRRRGCPDVGRSRVGRAAGEQRPAQRRRRYGAVAARRA
jgi:hypothetical protein